MTSRLLAAVALAALAPCASLVLHTPRPVLRPSTTVQILPVVAAPLIPRAPAVVATTIAAEKKPTAVYALILGSFVSFALDNVLRIPLFRSFYLYHSGVRWWPPVTSLFCHGSRSHLSNNLFLLLLFGRSVEDELGWGGLVFTYLFCGVLANLASLALLPAATVSIGASGAVFGLFAVSILARLSWTDLSWQKIIEVVVLGEFVFKQVLGEMRTAAGGGVAGINHVAHLSGAAAGVLLVVLLRGAMGGMERAEASRAGGA